MIFTMLSSHSFYDPHNRGWYRYEIAIEKPTFQVTNRAKSSGFSAASANRELSISLTNGMLLARPYHQFDVKNFIDCN
jgi:hypothetical protein